MDRPPLPKLLTFLPDRFRVLLPTGEEQSLKNIVSRMNIFRAPTDCVQYFTGTAGSVKSYNYAGGQILAGQRYNNCIRTSASNRSIGEVVQSRRRPLLGPSPG